jgi:hypothetical protein
LAVTKLLPDEISEEFEKDVGVILSKKRGKAIVDELLSGLEKNLEDFMFLCF